MSEIMITAGTRPEIIKMYPVIKELRRKKVNYVFVWTGQHYDYELSKVFFRELNLPEPDEDLNVGSGSHARQTADLLVSLERAIKKYSPQVVMSEGDTNSVLASAIASVKVHVPFVHVEAGLRSWNLAMPEEINRKIADSISSLMFAPTLFAKANLLAEGISESKIVYSGNTILDVLLEHIEKIKANSMPMKKFGLQEGKYVLVTVHRSENVDDTTTLKAFVRIIKQISKHESVYIPLHPHTRMALKRARLSIESDNVVVSEPLGYVDFLSMLLHSRIVMTDSGGVQEEAFILGKPIIILRKSTEWIETLLFGSSRLTGIDESRVITAYLSLASATGVYGILNQLALSMYGKGRASKIMTDALLGAVEGRIRIAQPDLRERPVASYYLLSRPRKGRFEEMLLSFDASGRFTADGRRIKRCLIRRWLSLDDARNEVR